MSVTALASCGSTAGGGASETTTASGAAQTTAASDTQVKGTVSTNGSTSMQKVISTLSEQFMNENGGITVTYDPTGSGTGIEAVKNGRTDIGLSSRKLKDSESGLTATTVALDGIAVIVNKDSKVEDLTVEQIAGIFTGEITNWNEVGGDDLEISCIGRESGSGTRDGFESVTKTSDKCKLAQELTSTGAVISAVQNNRTLSATASLSASSTVGERCKSCQGGRCRVSEATVLDGSYAIQRPFVLVTKDGVKLSDAAQKFFDYATSSAASDLIRKAGAVPVK